MSGPTTIDDKAHQHHLLVDVEAAQEDELLGHRSTDPLTDAVDRISLIDQLDRAVRRLRRSDGLVAVLIADLDRFELINDSLGHLVGDAVLRGVAERIRAVLRPPDALARWGDDEFAIVSEGLSHREAVALSARIVEVARIPLVVGDQQVTCTASVGLATTADHSQDGDGLLRHADLALRAAKTHGRDRADVFDEGLGTQAAHRVDTERMLRRAIAEDRLRVEFQPVVDLRSGATVAAEALVRVWDPDRRELVAADRFIGVADAAGLLRTIDRWVRDQALEHVRRWCARPGGGDDPSVAINVTPGDLADPAFPRSLIDLLALHGLPPAALHIELSERHFWEASSSTLSGLHLLREAGAQIGLDDFGTGYCSLSYLRLLPLDFLKIDRSFVGGLGRGATDQAIVVAVIDLAHTLGMTVVAEGVETRAQLDELSALGCDRAQGHLMRGPLLDPAC